MKENRTLIARLDDALRDTAAIAILRASTSRHLVAAARTLVDTGFRVVEFPLTTPGALNALSAAREAIGGDALIGAGTVLTAQDAERALGSGAQLLVSPGLCPDVAAVGRAAGVPVLPGAFTMTEVLAAQETGAALVKLFPADAAGPKYLAALRQPLPTLRAVPTGGLSPGDAGAWFAAGAAALGLGGSLVADTLETGRLDELRRLGNAWIREIKAGA